MILVGDRNTPWLRGTSIGAEIRINEGSGFRRESLILSGDVHLEAQGNLELDFEAPDVPMITDLRVTVPAYHTVHTALLFQRHRFYAGQRDTPELRTLDRPLETNNGSQADRADQMPGNNAASYGQRLERAPVPPSNAAPVEAPVVQPPWMPRESATLPPEAAPDRGRRRRLE